VNDGFLIEVLLVGALILLNGFFSGAEIAVISARRGRLQALADEGSRGAQAALRLKSDPDRFLATVQIGVTMVGTLASAVGGVAAIERLEPLVATIPVPWVATLAEPVAVGSVVLTIGYLSLVVGELMPKSLAVRHAETIALAVAGPIEALSRISGRLVAVLTASTRLGLRLLGQKLPEKKALFHTLDDIRALVEEAEEQGVIDTHVLTGAFAFHDRAVREVLTPRPDIEAIARTATVAEARRIAAKSGHTRFPVYEKDLDDVAGVLYVRELYKPEVPPEATIDSLVKPAMFVPQTKKATELLTEMRRTRRQMAFVVDEHGSLVGLITIEDLVEVIVGEIPDEHRVEEHWARVVTEGVVEADGSMPIHALNEELDLDLPESPDYVTIAGLVLDRLGSLPKGGEVVEIPPHRLVVTTMDGRRIARVRIVTGTPAPEPAGVVPG
jgi:putative hemolysin